MEGEIKTDYLIFSKSKTVLKIIEDEKLLFSDKILKINKKKNWQERNIVITNQAVYNFKGKSKPYKVKMYITYNSFKTKNTNRINSRSDNKRNNR